MFTPRLKTFALGVVDDDVAGVFTPRLKRFPLGVADDVVGVLLKRLLKVGALVAEACEEFVLEACFKFWPSVGVVALVGVTEGNINGLVLSEPTDDTGGWKKRDGAAEGGGAGEAGLLEVFRPNPPKSGFCASVDGAIDNDVPGVLRLRPPKSDF